MSALSIRKIRDSDDVDISVSGTLLENENRTAEIILRPSEFKEKPKTVKLNAVFHSINDGLTVTLYWEHEEVDDLMLPLNGRGILDLTRFGGLENPRKPGFTGNVVLVAERTLPGKKDFVLSLEFSKQRT